MPDTAMDLVFLDTETLGLHPDAPIWEFAAVRRFAAGGEDRTEFKVQHDPEPWVQLMEDDRHGAEFLADYRARYVRCDATPESDAAIMMHLLTRDALVIACNPIFDLPRIEKLIRRHDLEPAWHYHPFDISSMAYGAAAAAVQIQSYVLLGIAAPGPYELPSGPPWKSDTLAAAVGVDSADYPRHTAMGDVLWTIAQWDAVTGRV